MTLYVVGAVAGEANGSSRRTVATSVRHGAQRLQLVWAGRGALLKPPESFSPSFLQPGP